MSGLEASIRVSAGAFDLDVEINAPSGRTVAILGPNGAGKTTLLRVLAGLTPLGDGSVSLDGEVLDDTNSGRHVPTAHRPLAMVFQDRALFPHLDALDNVAFAARAGGASARTARHRAEIWLQRMDLPPDRWSLKPEALSGGAAQRVALARALARPSSLLLLDEPLAALDARSRVEMRERLRLLLDEHGGVRLVVTHDVVDAVALARSVVVVEDGRVTHTGLLESVLSEPQTEYVAGLADPRSKRGR